jgi:uncharacterized damage-inducible protein DinB
MDPTEQRPEPPLVADERAQLTGFLDFLRATVVHKSQGLSDEQARRPLLPSELTTVAGLLGHLAYVENYWFGVVLAGEPDPWREALTRDRDAEFRAALATPLVTLIGDYRRQCEHSRAVAAGMALEATAPFRGGEVNLRYVLIHLIEETSRHAGHLDVLRELTDGQTGE